MTNSIRNFFLLVFCVMLLTACATSGYEQTKQNHPSTNNADRFDQFSKDFLDRFWAHNPGWATYVGYYKYDDLLIVPDEAARDGWREFYTQTLKDLAMFDVAQLSNSQATDHALIKNQIESNLWYLDTFKQHQWDPSVYNVAVIFGLIMNTDYKSLEDRLLVVSKRLSNVPAYYQAAIQSLTTPTAEHTNLAIQQNKGALDVFESIIPSKITESDLGVEEKQDLQVKLAGAVEAIKQYISWLEAKEKSFVEGEESRSFRIGETFYEQKFKHDIVSNYSAYELYQKAIAEKNRLHDRMFKITKDLWSTYLADQKQPEDRLLAIRMMIDKLASKHVAREDFVTEIRRQMPILQKFIDDKDLLDSDPTRPLVVREAPAYQRGIAGASVDAPGPYDATANTYYNVTPLDHYTDEQAESYLREYNHWILQMLNIHEAMPGHYTQLMHANKAPSKIKTVFGNGAMIEGWAVYSELMMMEAGYSNNEPEMWLMYSKWNLRAVLNTVLDYQVHVLGMKREDAIAMLLKEGFQEQTEVDGKWRRVTVSQVQLTSYYNGYAEILALREELKEKLSEDFDLKTFHNTFLSFGNAPVPVIRNLMLQALETTVE